MSNHGGGVESALDGGEKEPSVASGVCVDYDKSDEARVSDPPRVLLWKLQNNRSGLENQNQNQNQPTSSSVSVSRINGNSKNKTGSPNVKQVEDHKKSVVVVEGEKEKEKDKNYDSILSAFDEFAKGKGESPSPSSSSSSSTSIGPHGYEIGDMVWGKVKSHPWWPGHIYNEAFASPSVRRSKTEGHVLVAFFGDSSYGWFHPAELIPFEDNFADKSRQTTSRGFLKAVQEAVDELSRKSSLGLACRCRNEFNFWPSTVPGYVVVDVGDYEPGIYGFSQITKSRDSFRPREMLSFVHQLALAPMNDHHSSIDFIKDKATVLACRKALFEEFDETYAQAFGTIPVRPPRPTAPVAMDPSKAPLSGRLVIAEALVKGKTSVKPTKTKDQVEKDKCLFKRRDEPIQMKSKKASSGQAGCLPHPLLVDGSGFSEKAIHMHHTSESGVSDGHNRASMASDFKPSKGGKKKAKVQKRPAGELNAENLMVIEKKKKKKRRKKEIIAESGEHLPITISNSAIALNDISAMGLHEKKNDVVVLSSSQSQQAVDFDKVELQMLMTDLRALALNPIHGQGRDCPSVIRQVFLKYRSLVYQKSLVLSPPSENEASEGNSIRLPATTDKTSEKIVKPSVRLDDPTKGGRKRGPSDHPENLKKKKKTDDVSQEIKNMKTDDVSQETKKKKTDNVSQEIRKKKKTDVSEEIKKKKKLYDSGETMKKKMDDTKLPALEKKIPQRSTDSYLKETAAKNVPTSVPKAVRVEANKKMVQTVKGAANPTMLVMKFPPGAALPSGAELRAKFACFGPLDHSATRVFWKSYTCRLVYHHRIDAEAALNFANGSSNLFGNSNVRSYLREMGIEAAESEPVVKFQKEDVSQRRDEQRIAAQPLEHPPQSVQLKSCLKKSSGDEGGNGGGRGGSRVKFVLGGNESTIEGSENNNKNKSIASCGEVLDINSKNLPKFIPQSTSTQFPINMPSLEQGLKPLFNAPPTQQPTNDISQQMLHLLMRCSDVVNNLTGVLGYVPYHPL